MLVHIYEDNSVSILYEKYDYAKITKEGSVGGLSLSELGNFGVIENDQTTIIDYLKIYFTDNRKSFFKTKQYPGNVTPCNEKGNEFTKKDIINFVNKNKIKADSKGWYKVILYKKKFDYNEYKENLYKI